MNINPSGHVPIYLQIADAVRAAVAAGVYRPGEMLPSLRAMAIQVHVNPNTVQRAYDELEREGLIYSQRGRGLFVAERGTALQPSVLQKTEVSGSVEDDVVQHQEIRDVLLKGKLRRFLALGHAQSMAASSRARARRTASWSLRSSSFFGSASVQ